MAAINKIRVNNVDYDLQELKVYDGQEKVIGTWYGKPLYQKSIKETATQAETLIDIASLNIDTMVDLRATCTSSKSGANQYSTYWKSSTDGFFIFYYPTTEKLSVQVGSTWPAVNATVRIIIEYTKTTDVMNN